MIRYFTAYTIAALFTAATASPLALATTITLEDHLKDNSVTIQIDKLNGSYIYSDDRTATCSALGYLGGSIGMTTKPMLINQYDTIQTTVQYMGFGARFYSKTAQTASGEDQYRGKIMCHGANCTLQVVTSVTCLKLQVTK